MPKFVDIEPLERNFEERYLDYRNRSQWELFTGKFRVDDTLTTAAMIMESCLDSLRKAPVADVAPVRHGHWIDTGFVNSTGKIFLCSECNHNHNPNKKDVAAGRVEERPKHCPGCGAKMDLEG